MKQNIIKKLSDRDHILLKSGMYIGGKSDAAKELYVVENNAFVLKEISYIPGLLKIIDEIIDNSIDEAIRTNFTFANKINITISKNEVQIADNGRGLPLTLGHDNIPMGVIAFTEARSGSNFSDDTKANGIGTNGVGSFLTNVFSKEFIVKTSDGSQELTLKSIKNAESYTYKIKDSNSKGTIVTFKPDLEKFDLIEISPTYISIIENRLRHLAQSFPEISFKINNQTIKALQPKKYLEMFGDNFEMIQGENYIIAITPNEHDDFKQFSYVNGLNISSGGTHIDYILSEIVNYQKDKLMKKYPSIKPGDIKNKLRLIAIFKDFPNLQFDSQTKERVTNSTKQIKEYLDIDFEKFNSRILKNPAIIDPITEVYKIKEEFKKRQELKDLEKPRKAIRSEKYTPAITQNKYLIMVEGASAFGSISPVLGRDQFAYYELKGKPLNSWNVDQSKFAQNKELSELYRIVKNEQPEYLIIGVDRDLDGAHIEGLLLGFIYKYLPEYKSKVGYLNTPIIAAKKNKKMVSWTYDLFSNFKIPNGCSSKYYKGLGSWLEEDLKYVLEIDGLDKMIQIFDDQTNMGDIEIIDVWLNEERSDDRKELILKNKFNIAKL